MILHVISLAQTALTAARARASKKHGIVARLRAQLEDAERENSLLEEELRLKDLRLARVKPRRRPLGPFHRFPLHQDPWNSQQS